MRCVSDSKRKSTGFLNGMVILTPSKKRLYSYTLHKDVIRKVKNYDPDTEVVIVLFDQISRENKHISDPTPKIRKLLTTQYIKFVISIGG
jgi:hydroxymethylpyrimidine pyrophosphatase-like HAD family hydrolase